MTVQNFNLEQVLPNPFQTRQSEDQEHVQSLAMSIAEQTMLQIPSARPSAADDQKVELVFGHSRLAAYKFLSAAGNTGFESIPLNLVEMTDEQMFQAAVAENRERKDLTPIEEALAMQVYIDQFHKTSAEVGELFHLSDSAVRGKMRLLNIPDEIKPLVGKSITEGAARELITFLDLPEELLNNKNAWETQTPREKMIDAAKAGASTELMAEKVSQFIFGRGQNMALKPWKHTDELVGDGIVGICKGCAFLQKRDNQDICMKMECYEAKVTAWQWQYLMQASLLSGILVLDDDRNNYSGHTSFHYGREGKLKKIRAGRCENLRLKYFAQSHTLDINSRVDGFDHAEIVCGKAERFCSCLNAIEHGISIHLNAELAGEQLKELNREVRAQKHIDADLIEHLRTQTEIAITIALQEGKFETWKKCIEAIKYSPIKTNDCQSLNQIYTEIAKFSISSNLGDAPRLALMTMNDLLKKCGLEELDIVLDVPEREEPKGKTLAEVFAEEEAASADHQD